MKRATFFRHLDRMLQSNQPGSIAKVLQFASRHLNMPPEYIVADCAIAWVKERPLDPSVKLLTAFGLSPQQARDAWDVLHQVESSKALVSNSLPNDCPLLDIFWQRGGCAQD
jgi:hypothetical protein